MAPAYLKEHRNGVYFQMPVPKWIRHRYAGIKRLVEPLGKFLDGKRDKAARALALDRARAYEKRFAEIAEIENTNPTALEGVTDVRKLQGRIEGLTGTLTSMSSTEDMLTRYHPEEDGPEDAMLRMNCIRIRREMENELAAAKAIPLLARPAPEHSWDGLYTIWEGKNCKRKGTHRRAIKLLKEHFPNRDFRTVKKGEMKAFRNSLLEQGIPKPMANSIMNACKGMFSAAVETVPGLDDSPADGVGVKTTKGKRDHFTGGQIEALLSKAVEIEWGGKRHDEAMWMLRVGAHQGLRLNETAQLRQSDLGKTASGLAYINIREGTDQSLKTGSASARKVALHPAIADAFYAWATAPKIGHDGKTTDYVFGAWPKNPSNGRGYWITSNFATLRKACGIPATGPKGGKLSYHSLRHSFVTARRKAGISEEMGEFLTGHAPSTVEGGYGGTDVDSLAALIRGISPLAIED